MVPLGMGKGAAGVKSVHFYPRAARVVWLKGGKAVWRVSAGRPQLSSRKPLSSKAGSCRQEPLLPA